MPRPVNFVDDVFLDTKVTILDRESSEGPYGVSETWNARPVVKWASVSPMRIETKTAYKQVFNTTITHRMVFREHLDLTPENNRLEWNGVQYEVVEVRQITFVDKLTIVVVHDAS